MILFPIKLKLLLLLPFLDPVVPRNPAVMAIILPGARTPGEKLTHANPKPLDELNLIKASLLPVQDKVHQLVTKVRLDPMSL